MDKIKWIVLASLITTQLHAQCVPAQHDPLATLLNAQKTCPRDVFELRNAIRSAGYKIQTTMVANRGFHNPMFGSFSLFEIIVGNHVAAGDWFIGHFTGLNHDGDIMPAQTPIPEALMVEVMAWDNVKGYYNFYELRGDGQAGQWFYRGDSADIFADNNLLHRQPNPSRPEFGDRLRCSGCHMAGGPIMKELTLPNNDWWEPVRKLDFGRYHPNKDLREMMQTLVSPAVLAEATMRGVLKLQNSKPFQKLMHSKSLQEQLRPLFCPMEVNLESDINPNDAQQDIKIPMNFLIDPRLLPGNTKPVYMSREKYTQLLLTSGSHFPETDDLDSDHPWLAPVKAASDQFAIDQLIQNKTITTRFLYAVLAIDMQHPQFSNTRCQLLRYIPETYTSDWQSMFIQNLQAANTPATNRLVVYLTNSKYQPAYFMQKAQHYVLQLGVKSPEQLYRFLLEARRAIPDSEISKNPRGQILEPGFRVIFPEASAGAHV